MEERLKKVEDYIKTLENANTIPRSIIEALTASGFLKLDKVISYESGASGNYFENMIIKAGRKNKMIHTEPIPMTFIVKSIADNLLTKTGGDYNLDGLVGKTVTITSDGTLPGGINIAVPIKVLSNNNDDFKLTTDGTNPINITNTGSGTHYLMYP